MKSVSVVIPLYNKAYTIQRAVDSVLAQTVPPEEIIVVNDGSTDDSLLAMHQFSRCSSIKIIDKPNSGVGSARNRGIEEARGELVAFLDSDDEWDSQFLATIHNLCSSYPEAGLFATSYTIQPTVGMPFAPTFHGVPQAPWQGILKPFFKMVARADSPVCSSATAVPRQVLAKLGGFNTQKPYGEDGDLWGRIALSYDLAFSSLPAATYHLNPGHRSPSFFTPEVIGHPFLDSVRSTDLSQIAPDRQIGLMEYTNRLRLHDACMDVLNKRFSKAVERCKGMPNFPFNKGRILWGTKLNRLTYLLWRLKFDPMV